MCMRNKTIVETTAIFKFDVFLSADEKTVDKRRVYKNRGIIIITLPYNVNRESKYSTNNDGTR